MVVTLTNEVGIPITKDELERIQVLESEFPDHCVDSRLLFDVNRYSPDPIKARKQFKKRLNMFECYKGILGVQGQPRTGKSGWVAAFAFLGKLWFDLKVVTLGFRYTSKFGKFYYIDQDGFMDEIGKTSLLAAAEGDDALDWKHKDIESLLQGSILVIEEAHKVLAKDNRNRFSMYVKDMLVEWGHYSILVILITPDLDRLDQRNVGKYITHEATVSRNYAFTQTSDVRLFHRVTGQWKDTIEFYRPNWHDLWKHNAPIMIRSNVSAKKVKEIHEKVKGSRDI